LVAALQKNAGREVLVDCTDQRKSLTGAKILAAALVLAGRIRRAIPEPRVGIVLPPGAGGLIANLAVVFAGKTPVNLNFTVGRAGLELCLRKSGVRTTLSADIFRRKLEERIPGLPWSERVLDLGRELAALPKMTLAGWLMAAKVLPTTWVTRLADIPYKGGDREAALLFTSGSAGEPKGVVLTHRNILGNCGQIDASGILPEGETLLANLPIFHSFGFTVILWYAILRGLRLVTVPSPLDTRKCIEAIRSEKVTAIVGTPTFLRPYLKRAAPGELASLKYAIAGAEKTPAGFAAEWEAHIGGEYFEGYGLTETSPVVAVNLPAGMGSNTARKRPGSVGRLFTGMAARIVDPDSWADRGRNETGMLLLRGLNVFPGYLDQPEATEAAFRDGWFVTGDLARIDDDGFIFIEGRLSRFSKMGGEMVPHGTIEQAILKAYDLQEQEGYPLAVSARFDAAKGETLVLLTTVPIESAELVRRLAAAGLPNLWIPRVVKRVEAIPTLASGKLDLRKLKELAAG
jgi:acyl-[acyl-carrier-protein]-phospholipid O-acyltransferase/long-chain-fatty-acid--[acyl-carrier-protein] ligase